MQHYGTPSSLGHKLSTSIHWLQLQLGCLGSPFSLPYSVWSHLAPISWTKCFWESLQYYQVDLRMRFTSLPLQRNGDVAIMEFLLPHMTTPATMASVNRCRCHLNMILLSDIATLDGTAVNSDMVWGCKHPLQSKMRFPPEHPTARDWVTWLDTWTKATGDGLTLSQPLGEWLRPPHFIWPWRYNEELREIYILGPNGFNVYRRGLSTWSTRSSNLHRQTLECLQTVTGSCVTLNCVPSPTGNSYHTPSQLPFGTKRRKDLWLLDSGIKFVLGAASGCGK